MKVALTGACGFIGSHIWDVLDKRGHMVVAIDNLSSGVDHSASRAFYPYDVGGNEGYVSDVIASCEVVIHAAAYADLRGNWTSYENRTRLIEANIEATWRLLEQVSEKARFVFLSTCAVYGSQGDIARPRTEYQAHPESCESPYAASKLACEALVAAYMHKRDRPYHIARLVNTVGARQTHGVIADFVRMYRDEGRIRAADDGRQSKSWVHVEDVANILVAMACDRLVPQGIYNVTSDETISWWDVVHAMGLEASDVDYAPYAGGAVGDPIGLRVSGDKLAPYFTPSRRVHRGISEALTHLGWTRRAA